MNIIDIIRKDEPDFSGICLREHYLRTETIKEFGVSMAWLFNVHRARNYQKVIITGYSGNKRAYFIADIKKIISIGELLKEEKWQEALNFQIEVFGDWINPRLEGKIVDNTLEDRFAVIFENATEIKQFSEDVQFSRSTFYYINAIVSSPIKPTLNESAYGEHIYVENIGKIKSAKVKLNGLTVIAGVNDTGKSTIGKTIFSMIKAISRYEQDLKESKEQQVQSKIERFYFKLRREIRTDELDRIREEFYPANFVKQIQPFLNESSQKLSDFFEAKQKFLSKFTEGIQQDFLNLRKVIAEKEDTQTQMKRALEKALFSEFLSEISPKGKNVEKKTLINYLSGNNNILSIELEQNKITNLICHDDLMFSDVVYIETPIFLQMMDLIRTADTMFDNEHTRSIAMNRPKVSLHIKDLISKVENAKYFSNTMIESDFAAVDVLKRISTIINGGFTFEGDGNRNDLHFTVKGNKENFKVKPVNTASGIKSFGLIQLLLQANILNDRCLLIIDEPENHLHPEWQVKYAEMLVELVKSEISVIITSHSPYMIQALKYYSEKNSIQDKTAFYFAEPSENKVQTVINEVTNNLNVIFSTLSAPLRNLVWQ